MEHVAHIRSPTSKFKVNVCVVTIVVMLSGLVDLNKVSVSFLPHFFLRRIARCCDVTAVMLTCHLRLLSGCGRINKVALVQTLSWNQGLRRDRWVNLVTVAAALENVG